MLYAKSTGGFYINSIHGDTIPSDAVEITDELYSTLLTGQAEGKQIFTDTEGHPFLVVPPGPTDLYKTDDGVNWIFDIDTAKKNLFASIQAEKKRVKDGGFPLDGVLFDSDDAANIAYLQLQVKLSSTPDYTIRWKASAGVWITMDATLFTSVAAGLEAHYSACFAWQEAKEIEIASCTTAAELEAVSVVFGE